MRTDASLGWGGWVVLGCQLRFPQLAASIFPQLAASIFSAVGSLKFFSLLLMGGSSSGQIEAANCGFFFRSWQPKSLGLPSESWAASCVLGYGRRKHGLPTAFFPTRGGARCRVQYTASSNSGLRRESLRLPHWRTELTAATRGGGLGAESNIPPAATRAFGGSH